MAAKSRMFEEDDLATGLSTEAVDLVARIASSVSLKITADLQSVSDLLRLSEPVPDPIIRVSEEREVERQIENEERLDKLYGEHLPHKLNELGSRQIIRAGIGQTNGARYFDPRPEQEAPDPEEEKKEAILMSLGSVIPTSPLSIAAVPSTDIRTIIPGKLVKAKHVPTAFEPAPEFIASLTGAMRSAMLQSITSRGDGVHKTFLRGKRLHVEKHNLPEDGVLCPFKFAEEGFEWSRAVGRKTVTTLDWSCPGCGGRHSLEILE